LKSRENEKGFVSVFVPESPVFTLSVVGLVAIESHPRDVAGSGQVAYESS
jgi:hypothetical protein